MNTIKLEKIQSYTSINFNQRKETKSSYTNKDSNILNRLSNNLHNKMKFTDMAKIRSEEINKQQTLDEEMNIDNQKLLVDVYNYDETYEMIQEFILKDRRDIDYNVEEFRKTRYVDNQSITDYFSKYKSFSEFQRKGLIKQMTPSFAFIKACNEQMLVPNPLGLIKRKGEDHRIKLSNFKVGDEFVKALAQSLMHSDHINELELGGNRLTFYGVSPLIKSIQDNKKLLKRLKVLDLSYNKIGSDSVDVIITYISHDECELQELNLEGDSLGDANCIKLCDSFGKYLGDRLTLLNLGRNLLSDESAVSIANVLFLCQSLQVLMLNWNHFKNYGASLIVNKLKKHFEMRVFDISWNSIGNNLSQEPTLDEVKKVSKTERNFFNFEANDFRRTMHIDYKLNPKDMKGTKPSKKPKENIVAAVATNTNLGPTKNVSLFGKELSELFKEPNIELVHLDISHNNITYEDSVLISHEVKKNHSILGIHLDGNEMVVDELGFITATRKLGKDNDFYANSQIYYQIGKEANLIKTNIKNVRKIRAKNNCWICEGWREVPFVYKPSEIMVAEMSGKSGYNHIYNVKVHLDFEGYKPHDTFFKQGAFSTVRMCPPGDICYFFTIDKIPVTDYNQHQHELREPAVYEFDEEYLKELRNIQLMNSYHKNGNNQNLISLMSEVDSQFDKKSLIMGKNLKRTSTNSQKELEIKRLIDNWDSNKIYVRKVGKNHVEINNRVIDDYFRKALKYCEPRPERNFNLFIKPRTPWTFPVSIWAQYEYKFEGDPEEFIDECFEHDFNRCGFIKDAKNEETLSELKKIMRKHYKRMYIFY